MNRVLRPPEGSSHAHLPLALPLGFLLALVSTLTATWWGLSAGSLILLALGAASRRAALRGDPEARGISLGLAALRQRHVEHLQAP